MIKRTLLALVVAGCGSSQKATPAPTPTPTPAPTVEKAVADYHDVLAPLWHAAPGPQRTEETCKQAPHMVELAAAIGEAGAKLKLATQALVEDCAAGRTAFDAKFHDVHEAFHQVAESNH